MKKLFSFLLFFSLSSTFAIEAPPEAFESSPRVNYPSKEVLKTQTYSPSGQPSCSNTVCTMSRPEGGTITVKAPDGFKALDAVKMLQTKYPNLRGIPHDLNFTSPKSGVSIIVQGAVETQSGHTR